MLISTLFTLAASCSDGNDGASPASDMGPVEDHGPDASCAKAPASQSLDMPYHAVSGVSPNLLSLDIYTPPRDDRCRLAPVVIWVHGGGWAIGDKKNKIADKVKLFNGAGYLLVSLNYRLSPNPPEPNNAGRVMFPTHPQDVARAVAWVVQKIKLHGGDPARVALMGHSAGAHLVALVSTDESYLKANGVKLRQLRCTASLDTEGYDIVTTMASASGTQKALYENAFGKDAKVWASASPLTHVAAGKWIPPFLFAARGSAQRKATLKAFTDKLKAASVNTTTIDASSLTHAQVNEQVGAAGDKVMTAPLMTFYKTCLGS